MQKISHRKMQASDKTAKGQLKMQTARFSHHKCIILLETKCKFYQQLQNEISLHQHMEKCKLHQFWCLQVWPLTLCAMCAKLSYWTAPKVDSSQLCLLSNNNGLQRILQICATKMYYITSLDSIQPTVQVSFSKIEARAAEIWKRFSVHFFKTF